MFRHPHWRQRPPSDQQECRRALWSFAKATGQHLGKASDDVISISDHLSPDFFYWGAGHWLWRTVRRPGLWDALYGLERTEGPVKPMAGSCHGEVNRDCWLPWRDVLGCPNESNVNLQQLAVWKAGQEMSHCFPGDRPQATKEGGVKGWLVFFSAGNVLSSWENKALPPIAQMEPPPSSSSSKIWPSQ